MAVIERLQAWAGRAPVPVFVAAGDGADPALAALRADPRVEVVTTPRHATVLVVAGDVPAALTAPLRLVHDQVPSPRAVVVAGSLPEGLDLAEADRVGPTDLAELVDRVRARHLDVVGGRGSTQLLGPRTSPVAWQGVGPHGQGGEGMMGGSPYGRPMPMPPTEGRDGLALDRLSLRFGPFLTGLPPGLLVDVGLQGDVLETVTLSRVPAPGGTGTRWPRASLPDPWLVALTELAALAGLAALARRTARLAFGASSITAADLAALRARADRPWALRAATDGVGRLRLDGVGEDVTARWRTWVDRVGGDAAPATSLSLQAVGDQLVGMELGVALLTLASLRPELAATRSATPAVTP